MPYYQERKYKTAKDLDKKLKEFRDTYDSSEPSLIPTKGKLDLFLEIAPSATRSTWKRDREDLHLLIVATELWIKEQTKTEAYKGNRHAEYELSRAFGMTEKQVIEQTNTTIEMTAQEKAERLARLMRKDAD